MGTVDLQTHKHPVGTGMNEYDALGDDEIACLARIMDSGRMLRIGCTIDMYDEGVARNRELRR